VESIKDKLIKNNCRTYWVPTSVSWAVSHTIFYCIRMDIWYMIQFR
jgi:hypothetical protein